MSGHTQGPWETERVDWNGDGPGENAVSFTGLGWGGFAKCVVRIEGETFDRPEGVANARLISAAPDMLAALADFVLYDDWDSSEGTGMMIAYDIAISKARAAIEKATGQ